MSESLDLLAGHAQIPGACCL